MWKQIGFLIAVAIGLCFAQDYSSQDFVTGDQDARAQHIVPNYAHHGHGHGHHDGHYDPHLYDNVKAEPYDFGFQSTDEFGTVMNRQETSDNNGAVRGSYGYTDPLGIFRHVDYVADEYGFRAQVKSNEPGIGSQSPANVEIFAEPPPAGVVVDRPHHHHHASNPVPSQIVRQPQSGRLPGSAVAASSVTPSRQVRPPSSQTSPIRNTIPTGPVINAPSRGLSSGQFVPSTRYNPYPSAVQEYPQNVPRYTGPNQYPTAINVQEYPQNVPRYAGPNPYPPRSNYGQSVASAHSQQVNSQVAATSTTTSSQTSTSAARGGYRNPIGNPYVSNLVKSDEDKVEGATVVLPTVVTSGVPTLVKHIHTYPVAVQ